MYAVVKTGGKQYKVAENDVLKVEKLAGEAGATVELADVLMVSDGKDLKVGSPFVDGTVVTAEILEQTRGDKITVFKKKRRQNYRRKKGHRQDLTVLRVTGIGAGAKKAAPKKAAAKADAPAEPKADEAAPTKKASAKKAPAKKADSTAKKPAAKSATSAAAKKPAAKKTTAAKKPAADKE